MRTISTREERGGRSIRAACLVPVEMLTAGMGEVHGIWGGAGWRERSRLRVERVVGVHRVA